MRHNFQYKFQLNTNQYLSQCNPRDVIAFNSEKWIDVNKLKSIVYQSFSSEAGGIRAVSSHISSSSNLSSGYSWFDKGKECEILRAGSSGWQKGKIKINVTLEFIPDEPEETSLLDDIRQADAKNNL